MSEPDDRWRDSYDAWKTREPDYYYDQPDVEHCEHEEYDVDFEGRASCNSCNHRWWLTPDELSAWDETQVAHAKEYDRYLRREQSKLWCAWRWLKSCISLRTLSRLYLRWFPHRRVPKWVHDDEIPF